MSKRKINISDIFDEANNENVTVLPKSETLYNIDYSEFEVNEDEKQTLIKCEHDISHHLKNIGQHMLWYYDALYQANEIFSNHKTGCWSKWLEKIGIKRNKANIAIRKYKLYLQGKYNGNDNQQVLELPDRAIIKMTGEDEFFLKLKLQKLYLQKILKKSLKILKLKKI